MSISEIHTETVPSTNDDRRGEFREANHRIANNLALVSAMVRMQATALSKKNEPLTAPEAAAVLLETAARIESVARLHRLLSQDVDLTALAAGPYLSDICAGVSGSLSACDGVEFHDQSGAAQLAPNRLNALGLFLTEALTNAFKYAHPAGAPGRIMVTFRRNGHNLELESQDDGVGLPEGFNPHKDGGLGFRILRSLAKQMSATLSFPRCDVGFCLRLDLPVAVAIPAR